jgi:thiol-disulfide isomerase/thioredoxin
MIAQAHREVKFIRLNVQKAQFMVQKLSIKTLPTIVLFTDGVAKDRIVGFDELGGRDVFPTRFVSNRCKAISLIAFVLQTFVYYIEKAMLFNLVWNGR